MNLRHTSWYLLLFWILILLSLWFNLASNEQENCELCVYDAINIYTYKNVLLWKHIFQFQMILKGIKISNFFVFLVFFLHRFVTITVSQIINKLWMPKDVRLIITIWHYICCKNADFFRLWHGILFRCKWCSINIMVMEVLQ